MLDHINLDEPEFEFVFHHQDRTCEKCSAGYCRCQLPSGDAQFFGYCNDCLDRYFRGEFDNDPEIVKAEIDYQSAVDDFNDYATHDLPDPDED